MRRLFEGGKLVIATHNQGKAKEIAALLKGHLSGYETAASLNLPEPEETGLTFEENAVLKARAAAQASGLPALADDSGLSVAGLNGAPGIYSARWAGVPRDFTKAMERVQDELGNNPDRTGAFICVLALAWPDGHVETYAGDVQGQIVWPPRGDKGFGYDPVFVPNGYEQTFAEMEPEEKHKISHRATAFERFLAEGFKAKG